MLLLLIRKELRALLLTPKFAVTFALTAVLILLSIVIGVREYRASVRAYEAALQLTDQTMRSQSSWMRLSTNVYRAPDPMQVFVAGTAGDIGRMSPISQSEGVKLKHSAYSDDPLFALFRTIDVAFIVTVVLSLFALVFTYDAINGEREGGTLQLTFANPVPRVTYLAAKLFGTWIGLAVPLAIPVLLGLLLVLLSDVPLTQDHWVRLSLFAAMSLLFFTFFIVLGVLVSSFTRRPVVSFLVSLVIWVTLVLIVPRAAVMAAGWLQPVPTVAEVEGQRDAFARDAHDRQMRALASVWRSRNEQIDDMEKDERDRYREEHASGWMTEDVRRREEVEKEVEAYSIRLNEELRTRRQAQERLASALSMISPAATYQLAAMKLAGTDAALKTRYEDAMRAYRNAFTQFTQEKQKQSGSTGGFMITVDSEQGLRFSAPREIGALDLSALPSFEQPKPALSEMAGGLIADAGVLGLFSMIGFGLAIWAFGKFDLRP